VLVRDFIKSVSNTKTVILTTHNMDEADRLSDRVAVIDSGKLLVLDTPYNLKSSIGEGDILEIQMSDKADENTLRTALASYCSFVKLSDGILLLKSKNLVAHVPEIILALKAMNVSMGEIRLRENSLEDVFIHLTGRSLRQ
jgi:ABC-2 type transport system ATP-binding protein